MPAFAGRTTTVSGFPAAPEQHRTLANSSPDISPWETCGDGFRGTCTAWVSRTTRTERLGHPTGRASSRPSVQEFSGPVGRASCQAKVTGPLSTSPLSVHQRDALMSRYIGTVPPSAGPCSVKQSISIRLPPRGAASKAMVAKVGVAARHSISARPSAAAAPSSSQLAPQITSTGWAWVMCSRPHRGSGTRPLRLRNLDPFWVGRGFRGVVVVPVPPFVRRGLGVALRRVLPNLLSAKRCDVEVAPGGPYGLIAAVVDEIGAEHVRAVAEEHVMAVPLIHAEVGVEVVGDGVPGHLPAHPRL